MRLVSRLLISHTLLAVALLGVLTFMGSAIVRMDRLIDEVRENYLGAIEEDEAMHRAGWAVEVSMRHAIAACDAGASDADVAARITGYVESLREVDRRVGDAAARPIRDATRRYDAIASKAIGSDTCARLRAPEGQRERIDLDERLTDAWIGQLVELHRHAVATEEEARRTGEQALAVGAAAGILALLAAAIAAQRLASGVTRPLSTLAHAAQRVGEGDFSAAPKVRGPIEVTYLALELDRMRERLAELDALKQAFIASVSHELRTPLAKLREALSLIADGATGTLTDRQRRVVDIAKQACEQEIRIVSALLDLSRLRSGSPLKIKSGSSLDDAFHQAVGEERGEAERRGVSLEIDAPGEAPIAALDGPMVERAIANILRNAVSVSREGQAVRLERAVLERGPEDRPGPWAKIVVRDQGPGIDPAIRATLFKPFVAHSVREHPERVGIGLGLALAGEVASAHGGKVEILDGDGPGAIFALWIPLYRTSCKAA